MSHALDSFKIMVKKALREVRDLPPLGKDRIRANLLLQVDYPDRYVAYVDSVKIRKKVRRLEREVIAHAPTLPELYDQLDQLPSGARTGLQIHYITDPEGPIVVHNDFPGHSSEVE